VLAELGHIVYLIEIDPNKIEIINSGKPPIYEKGLESLILKHLGHNFMASESYDYVSESDLIFICVGTHKRKMGMQIFH
jgi:UDPglucose 6-dehydrogenase